MPGMSRATSFCRRPFPLHTSMVAVSITTSNGMVEPSSATGLPSIEMPSRFPSRNQSPETCRSPRLLGRQVLSRLSDVFCVRREKARIFSGCESRPATVVAPAGSNRSGGGGNKTAEAFDAKGRLGRLREQAGRNASERRAGLERRDVGADPPQKRGRLPSLGDRGATPAKRRKPVAPPG